MDPDYFGVEPQAQSPALAPKKTHFLLGMNGIALGLFLALFEARVASHGIVDGQMIWYAAGSALPPALIAYLIAGRKSVRNFDRFGLWFSGVSIFFLIVRYSVR